MCTFLRRCPLLVRFALLLAFAVAGSAYAISPPPPPTMPEVCAGFVNAGILALGTLAALVLGGFFSFWLVKKTMVWSNKIG